jgi:hypothetical protein
MMRIKHQKGHECVPPSKSQVVHESPTNFHCANLRWLTKEIRSNSSSDSKGLLNSTPQTVIEGCFVKSRRDTAQIVRPRNARKKSKSKIGRSCCLLKIRVSFFAPAFFPCLHRKRLFVQCPTGLLSGDVGEHNINCVSCI